MMVVGMAKPTLHLDLPSVARDYDFVVIDGAPRVNELGRAAILASDTILIPVQPSHDVWAAAQTVELIREAQQYKTRLRAAFVINRKIVNTAIGRDVVTCWFRSLLDGHARPQSQKKLPYELRAAEAQEAHRAVHTPSRSCVAVKTQMTQRRQPGSLPSPAFGRRSKPPTHRARRTRTSTARVT
jgi:cellulose biosynthesis protein BcsQ